MAPAGNLASAQALRQQPLLKEVGRSCGQAWVISEVSVRSLRWDNGAGGNQELSWGLLSVTRTTVSREL